MQSTFTLNINGFTVVWQKSLITVSMLMLMRSKLQTVMFKSRHPTHLGPSTSKHVIVH